MAFTPVFECCSLLSQIKDVDGLKMLQLRNPWGTSAWIGPYSDTDADRWTPRLKALLNFDPERRESKERGVFWMEVSPN